MLDTHASNKQTLDFKERLRKQQRMEHRYAQDQQRKQEEDQMNQLKIQDKLHKATNKKQYYQDLAKQKKVGVPK